MRTFAENIKSLRKSRGYTQEKFAKAIGTKQVNVSAWELGTRTPYLSTIREIADTFKVPLSSLISFEDTGIDEDYVNSLAESLQREPRLKTIFDKLLYMQPSDLDAIIGIINAMAKEK